jgi:hypothetical protein
MTSRGAHGGVAKKLGVGEFARDTYAAKSGGLHLCALTRSVSSYYHIIAYHTLYMSKVLLAEVLQRRKKLTSIDMAGGILFN